MCSNLTVDFRPSRGMRLPHLGLTKLCRNSMAVRSRGCAVLPDLGANAIAVLKPRKPEEDIHQLQCSHERLRRF